jgi:hypothetical protein
MSVNRFRSLDASMRTISASLAGSGETVGTLAAISPQSHHKAEDLGRTVGGFLATVAA